MTEDVILEINFRPEYHYGEEYYITYDINNAIKVIEDFKREHNIKTIKEWSMGFKGFEDGRVIFDFEE